MTISEKLDYINNDLSGLFKVVENKYVPVIIDNLKSATRQHEYPPICGAVYKSNLSFSMLRSEKGGFSSYHPSGPALYKLRSAMSFKDILDSSSKEEIILVVSNYINTLTAAFYQDWGNHVLSLSFNVENGSYVRQLENNAGFELQLEGLVK